MQGKAFRYEFYVGDKLIKVINADSLKSNVTLQTIMRKFVESGKVESGNSDLLHYKMYEYGTWRWTHRYDK